MVIPFLKTIMFSTNILQIMKYIDRKMFSSTIIFTVKKSPFTPFQGFHFKNRNFYHHGILLK